MLIQIGFVLEDIQFNIFNITLNISIIIICLKDLHYQSWVAAIKVRRSLLNLGIAAGYGDPNYF
ncbi:hypothetical protein GCM10025860_15150 [Methanobacterium ferruginis]|nr:hypothetical protein GCM10025860_15150 [Methanobacterium ferruginis]